MGQGLYTMPFVS